MKIPATKILASVVAACFFTTQIALGAVAESNVWAQRRLASLPGSMRPSSINTGNLTDGMPSIGAALPSRKDSAMPRVPASLAAVIEAIPAARAVVQDMSPGSIGKPPVVIVQDIHLNPEAQANIAGTLRDLSHRRAVAAIAVEGAFGPFDFSRYHAFPDASIVEKVSRVFLEERRVSGASQAGISDRGLVPMSGVDDPEAYGANVDAYLGSRASADGAAAALSRSAVAIEGRKAGVLSEVLRDYDKARSAFRENRIGLGAYLRELVAQVEPEFVVERFLAAHAMESAMDFNRVAEERRRVVERLVRALDESEVNELLARSAAYRLGRLSYASYYQKLRDLCARKNVNLAATPAFDNYIRYILLADGIRADELFQAVERMDAAAIRALAATGEQRALIDLSDAVGLASKLVRFELTPTEWKRYEELSSSRSTELAALGLPDLAVFESFYRRAEERSDLIAAKLERSGRATALVTGGFHTPQIASLLRKRGVPYVVVSPRLTRVDAADGSAYLAVFAREKTPLDRLFAGERLFVTPSAVNVGSGHPSTVPTDRQLRFHAADQTLEAGLAVPPETGVTVVSSDGTSRRLAVDGIVAEARRGSATDDAIGRRLGTRVTAARSPARYLTAAVRLVIRFTFVRILGGTVLLAALGLTRLLPQGRARRVLGGLAASLAVAGVLFLSQPEVLAQPPSVPQVLRDEKEKDRQAANDAERKAREAEAAAAAEDNALAAARAIVARGEANVLKAEAAAEEAREKAVEAEAAVETARQKGLAARADAAQVEADVKAGGGRWTVALRTDFLKAQIREAEAAVAIVEARRRVILADADAIAATTSISREGVKLAEGRAALARLNGDDAEATRQSQEARRLKAAADASSRRAEARRAETSTLDDDKSRANSALGKAQGELKAYETRVREAQNALVSAQKAAGAATDRRVKADEAVTARATELASATTALDAARQKEASTLADFRAANARLEANPKDAEIRVAALRARAAHLIAIVDRLKAESAADRAVASHELSQAAALEAEAREAEAKAVVADVRRLADESAAQKERAAEARKGIAGHNAAGAAANSRIAAREPRNPDPRDTTWSAPRGTIPAAEREARQAWNAYRDARAALDRANAAASQKAAKTAQPVADTKLDAQRRVVEDAGGKLAAAERAESAASEKSQIATRAFETAQAELRARETRLTLADSRVRELERAGARTKREIATLERARADAAAARSAVSDQKVAVAAARTNAVQAEAVLSSRNTEREAAAATLADARRALDAIARAGERQLERRLEEQRAAERRRLADMPPVVPPPAEVRPDDGALAPAPVNPPVAAAPSADDTWNAFVDEIVAKVAATRAALAEREAAAAPQAVAPAPVAPQVQDVAATEPEDEVPVSLSEAAADEARLASTGFVGWFLGLTAGAWTLILGALRIRRGSEATGDDEEEAPAPAAPARSTARATVNPADAALQLVARGDGEINVFLKLGADGSLEFEKTTSSAGSTGAKALLAAFRDRAAGRPLSMRFDGTMTRLLVAVPGRNERMELPLAAKGRMNVRFVGDRPLVQVYVDASNDARVTPAHFARMAARFGFFADIGRARDRRTPQRVASAAAFNQFLQNDLTPADPSRPAAANKERIKARVVWDAIRRLRSADPDFWRRASDGVAWVASRRSVEEKTATPPAQPAAAPVAPVETTANVEAPADRPEAVSETPTSSGFRLYFPRLRLAAAGVVLLMLVGTMGSGAAAILAPGVKPPDGGSPSVPWVPDGPVLNAVMGNANFSRVGDMNNFWTWALIVAGTIIIFAAVEGTRWFVRRLSAARAAAKPAVPVLPSLDGPAPAAQPAVVDSPVVATAGSQPAALAAPDETAAEVRPSAPRRTIRERVSSIVAPVTRRLAAGRDAFAGGARATVQFILRADVWIPAAALSTVAVSFWGAGTLSGTPFNVWAFIASVTAALIVGAVVGQIIHRVRARRAVSDVSADDIRAAVRRHGAPVELSGSAGEVSLVANDGRTMLGIPAWDQVDAVRTGLAPGETRLAIVTYPAGSSLRLESESGQATTLAASDRGFSLMLRIDTDGVETLSVAHVPPEGNPGGFDSPIPVEQAFARAEFLRDIGFRVQRTGQFFAGDALGRAVRDHLRVNSGWLAAGRRLGRLGEGDPDLRERLAGRPYFFGAAREMPAHLAASINRRAGSIAAFLRLHQVPGWFVAIGALVVGVAVLVAAGVPGDTARDIAAALQGGADTNGVAFRFLLASVTGILTWAMWMVVPDGVSGRVDALRTRFGGRPALNVQARVRRALFDGGTPIGTAPLRVRTPLRLNFPEQTNLSVPNLDALRDASRRVASLPSGTIIPFQLPRGSVIAGGSLPSPFEVDEDGATLYLQVRSGADAGFRFVAVADAQRVAWWSDMTGRPRAGRIYRLAASAAGWMAFAAASAGFAVIGAWVLQGVVYIGAAGAGLLVLSILLVAVRSSLVRLYDAVQAGGPFVRGSPTATPASTGPSIGRRLIGRLSAPVRAFTSWRRARAEAREARRAEASARSSESRDRAFQLLKALLRSVPDSLVRFLVDNRIQVAPARVKAVNGGKVTVRSTPSGVEVRVGSVDVTTKVLAEKAGIRAGAGETLPAYAILRLGGDVEIDVEDASGSAYSTTRPAGANVSLLLQIDSEGTHLVAIGDKDVMWEAGDLHDTIRFLRAMGIRPIAQAADINLDNARAIVERQLADPARRAQAVQALRDLREANAPLHDRLGVNPGVRVLGFTITRGQLIAAVVIAAVITAVIVKFYFAGGDPVAETAALVPTDGAAVQQAGMGPLALLGLLIRKKPGSVRAEARTSESTTAVSRGSARRGSVQIRLLLSFIAAAGAVIGAASVGLLPTRRAPDPAPAVNPAPEPAPKPANPPVDPAAPPAPAPAAPAANDGQKPAAPAPAPRMPEVADVLRALAAQAEGEKPFQLTADDIRALEGEIPKADQGVAYEARQYEIALRRAAVARREMSVRDRLNAEGGLYAAAVHQPNENNEDWLRRHGNHRAFEPHDRLWRVVEAGGKALEFTDAASFEEFIRLNAARVHIYLSHATPGVIDHLSKRGIPDRGGNRVFAFGADGEITNMSDVDALRRNNIDVEVWIGVRSDRDNAAAPSYRLVTGRNAALGGSVRAREDWETRQRQIRLLETLLTIRGAPAIVAPAPAEAPVLPAPVFGADAGRGLIARLPEPGGRRAVVGARFPALRDQLNVEISERGARRTVNLIDLVSDFAGRHAAPNALQTSGASGRHRAFWAEVGPQVLEGLPGVTALPAGHAAGAINSSSRHAGAIEAASAALSDPAVTFESAQDAVRRSGLAHWTAHAGESAGLFFPALGQNDPYYSASALLRYLEMMADNTDTAIAGFRGGSRVPGQPVADIRPAWAASAPSAALRNDLQSLAGKVDEYRLAWEGGERETVGGLVRTEPAARTLLTVLGDAPDARKLASAVDHPKIADLAGMLEQIDTLTIQILNHPEVAADPALRARLMGALDWRGALVRDQIRKAEIVGRGRRGAGRDAIQQQIVNSVLVQQGRNLPRLWATVMADVMRASGADPAFAGWRAPAAPAAAAVAAPRREGVAADVAPRIERPGLPDATRQATVRLPPPVHGVELTPFERPDVADPGPYRNIPSDVRPATRVRGARPTVEPSDVMPATRTPRPSRRPLVTPAGLAAPALPVTPAPAGAIFEYVLVGPKGDAVLALTAGQMEELREAGWIHFTRLNGRGGDEIEPLPSLLSTENPRRRMWVADPERVPLYVRPRAGIPILAPVAGPLPAAAGIAPWVVAGESTSATEGITKAGGYEVLATRGAGLARAEEARDDAATARAEADLSRRLRDTDDFLLVNRDRTVWGGLTPVAEQRIIVEGRADRNAVRIFLPGIGQYVSIDDFESPVPNSEIARELNKGRYTIYRRVGGAYQATVSYEQLILLGREIVFDGDTGRRLTHAESLSPLRNSASLVRYMYVGGNLLEQAHPDTIFPDLQNLADIRGGYAVDLKQVAAGDRAAAMRREAAEEQLRVAAQQAFITLKGINGSYAVIVQGTPGGPARTSAYVPVVGFIASKEDFDREFGGRNGPRKLAQMAQRRGLHVILTDNVSLSVDAEGHVLQASATDVNGGAWSWIVSTGDEDRRIEGAIYAMRVGRRGEIRQVYTQAEVEAQTLAPRRQRAPVPGSARWALLDPSGHLWPMHHPGNYSPDDLALQRTRTVPLMGFDRGEQTAPTHTRFAGVVDLPTNDLILFGHASVTDALKTRMAEFRRLQNQSLLLMVDGLSALDALPKLEVNVGNGLKIPVAFDMQQIAVDLHRPSFLPMGNPTLNLLARIQLANEGILLREGEAWAAPQLDDSEFRLSSYYPVFNLGLNAPVDISQLPPTVTVRVADERERARMLAVPMLMPVNINEEGLIFEFEYQGRKYNLNFGKQAAQRGVRDAMRDYLITAAGPMRAFNGGVQVVETRRMRGRFGAYPITVSQAYVGSPQRYIEDLARAGVVMDRDMTARYEVGTRTNGRGELSGTRTVRVTATGGVAGAQVGLFEASKQEELSRAMTDLRLAGGGEVRIEYVARATGEPTVTIVKTEGAAGIDQGQRRVRDAIAAIPAGELRYDAASQTYSHRGRVVYSVRSHWLYEYDANGRPVAASQVVFSPDAAADRADLLAVEADQMEAYLDVLRRGGVIETDLATGRNTFRPGVAALGEARLEAARRPIGEQIAIGRTGTFVVDMPGGRRVQKQMISPQEEVRDRFFDFAMPDDAGAAPAIDAAGVPADEAARVKDAVRARGDTLARTDAIRRTGGVIVLNGQTGALERMEQGADAVLRAMADIARNFNFAERQSIDEKGYRYDLDGRHYIVVFGETDYVGQVLQRLVAAEQARELQARAIALARAGRVPPNFADAFTVSELLPGYGEPGRIIFDRDGYVKTRVTNLVTREVATVTNDAEGNMVRRETPEMTTDYNVELERRIFRATGARAVIPAKVRDARGDRVVYSTTLRQADGRITGFTITGAPAAGRALPQGTRATDYEVYSRGNDSKGRPIMGVRRTEVRDNGGRTRMEYDADGFLVASRLLAGDRGQLSIVTRPRIRGGQVFVDNGGNFLNDVTDAFGQPSVRHDSPLGQLVRVDAGPRSTINGNFIRHPETGEWIARLTLSLAAGEPREIAVNEPAAGGGTSGVRYTVFRQPGRNADGSPIWGRAPLAGEAVSGLGYLEARRFAYLTPVAGETKTLWIEYDAAAERAAFEKHGLSGVEIPKAAYDRDPRLPGALRIREYETTITTVERDGRTVPQIRQTVKIGEGAQAAIDALIAAQPDQTAKDSLAADFRARRETGMTTVIEPRAMSFWDGTKETPFQMMVPVEKTDEKGGRTVFHYDVPNAFGLATRGSHRSAEEFTPEVVTMLENVRGEPYVDRVTGRRLIDTPIAPMNEAGKEGLFRFEELKVLPGGKAETVRDRYMNAAGMFVLEETASGDHVRASDFVPHPITGEFAAQRVIVRSERGTIDEITITYDPVTGEQREVSRPIDKMPDEMGMLGGAEAVKIVDALDLDRSTADRGQGTIPLGVRLFGDGYVRHAFWIETLVFAVLPALSGAPLVWLAATAAFAGLHVIDRGALRGTGVRVSAAKVAVIAGVNLAAMVLLSAAFTSTLSPDLAMASIAVTAAAMGVHGGLNRSRSAASLLSEPARALVRALSRSGDVESRRRAIVELVGSDAGDLRIDLDSIAVAHRTGLAAGDMAEFLSGELDRALDGGATRRGVQALSARAHAGLRQAITGDDWDIELFGGSLGSLHADAMRSATDDRPILNYQFITGGDAAEAARQAAYSARRLFERDGQVALVLVVETDDAARAARAAVAGARGAVEVVVRTADMTFSSVRDAALSNRAIRDMADRSENRLLIPAGISLPEGFFDLSPVEMARYRTFVLIIRTLNAIAVEIRGQNLGEIERIQRIVASQA